MTREEFEKLKTLPFFKGKIVSGSMSPLIEISDEIVVEVGQEDIQRFDIIVFFYDGKLICHYLWSMNRIVEPILMQTRNLFGNYDYPVKKEDYLGKVVSHKINFWRKIRILF